MHLSAIPRLLTISLALWSGSAAAHIQLVFPPPRTADLKYGPCGTLGGGARGDVITTFSPGETITVTWNETIGHPGHYRISFDADGQDDFVDPSSYTDTYSAPSVLLDDIADETGTGPYSADITLPNVECDNCTLQLIQVMTDKTPYGDGNDLYYQCADIVIAGAGGAGGTGGSAGATGSGGGGGSSAASGSTGAGGLPASGGAGGADAGSAGSGGDTSGGCACTVPSSRGLPAAAVALLALGVGALRARRRRRP